MGWKETRKNGQKEGEKGRGKHNNSIHEGKTFRSVQLQFFQICTIITEELGLMLQRKTLKALPVCCNASTTWGHVCKCETHGTSVTASSKDS